MRSFSSYMYAIYRTALSCKWIGNIAFRSRDFHEHTELETWYMLVRGSPNCLLFMHHLILGLR